jgi:glyoxylase-like metal-dependent hydrolase (beta-lactamase superfamily II)
MIKITNTVNALAMENTYYIYNEKNLLIIDPGSDTETILATIKELEKTPVAILLTHTHYDHIISLDIVREKYSIPVYVSPLEADWLQDPMMNLSGLARHMDLEDIVLKPAEYLFVAEKTYTLGEMSFKVVETPGHSIGSVSFIFDTFVVSGDALFNGSIGRWDLPTGDQSQLLQSIQEQLFILPNEMDVYPGHGPKTTVGHEKNFNPFFG